MKSELDDDFFPVGNNGEWRMEDEVEGAGPGETGDRGGAAEKTHLQQVMRRRKRRREEEEEGQEEGEETLLQAKQPIGPQMCQRRD